VQLPVDWLTVTTWPPTAIVPVRGVPAPFAATVKLKDPSPDIPPLVIVIQVSVVEGDHAQALPVITEMLLFIPVDGALTIVGDTLNVHWASAARASSPHQSTAIRPTRTPERRRAIHRPFS